MENLFMKDKTGRELTNQEVMNKGLNRLKTIWKEFVVYLLHLFGCFPSHTVRKFVYQLAGLRIGKASFIHMHPTFYDLAHIHIGHGTIIGERAVLDGRDTLRIGDHVDIASEVMIYNAEHDVQSEDFHAEYAPVTIEDYVFIGPRAIILPGVTIRKGAVVGAGAVVTKNVEAFTIVGGVPARVIGERQERDLHYKLGRAAWFR